MQPLALALLLYACTFGPDVLAPLLGHSVKAWEYVAQGAEAAALWGIVFAVAPRFAERWPAAGVRVVALLGALSAAQRGCRLLLPMDRAPQTGSASLCQAALGDWQWWLTVGAFFWGAAYVARGLSNGNGTNHR